MANSLLTGVSGLTSHQHLIEVVGNNLANLSTAGFKARRAHFADVFYETVKGGAGGGVGAAGGAGGSLEGADTGGRRSIGEVSHENSAAGGI